MWVFVRYAWSLSWVMLAVLLGAGCELSVGSGEPRFDDDWPTDSSVPDGGEQSDAGLDPADASSGEEPPMAEDAATEMMEPFEVERLSTAVASAQCKAQEDCVGTPMLTARLRGADCVDVLAAGLREGALGQVEAAIAGGFLEYDEGEMTSCLEDLADLRCAVSVARLGDLCAEALRGTASVGEECISHFDCAGDSYCDYGSELSCPGVCRPRLAQGDPCLEGDDEVCQVGLRCLNERCNEPAETGDSCEFEGECGLDHECVPKDGGGRWCRPVDAVYSGVQDDECSPQTVLCELELASGLGLVCDRDLKTCVPASASGQACTPGSLPEPCPPDEYCEPEQRLCVARVQQAAACQPGVEKQCEVGHACIDDTCVRLALSGEACESDAACYSGICNLVRGTCDAVLSCL